MSTPALECNLFLALDIRVEYLDKNDHNAIQYLSTRNVITSIKHKQRVSYDKKIVFYATISIAYGFRKQLDCQPISSSWSASSSRRQAVDAWRKWQLVTATFPSRNKVLTIMYTDADNRTWRSAFGRIKRKNIRRKIPGSALATQDAPLSWTRSSAPRKVKWKIHRVGYLLDENLLFAKTRLGDCNKSCVMCRLNG